MSSDSRSFDGTILRRFRGESLNVGWHTPEVAENGNYTRLELCGHMVVIHKETLKDLAGKRIVVEMVEVGVPSPASKREEMLRAV